MNLSQQSAIYIKHNMGEKYLNSPNIPDFFSDIREWLKTTEKYDERLFEQFKNLIENKKVLDFGCTNGGFLIKAKDCAKSLSAIKCDDSFKSFFESNKIKLYKNIDEIKEKFDVITLFNVLESFESPEVVLEKLSKKLNKGGVIIIEAHNCNDALLSFYKSKAFESFAQENRGTFLFNDSNLAELIKKAKLKALSIRQIQRYPLSNHLNWIINKAPRKTRFLNFIDKIFPIYFYQMLLKKFGSCDTLISIISH